MGLRLVRQTSDIPNITNKDDATMARYAYGGYNGVIKALGSELNYTAVSGVFKVLDGGIVIDGWEVTVDGFGWSLDLHTVVGTQYHSVYAEINVATESVKLDSTYLGGQYPEVAKGDDLTAVPNGTARLLLYNVKVQNGVIAEVIKRFEIIPYLTQKVLDIEQRLERLGFNEGVSTEVKLGGGHLSINKLYRQGNYVFGRIKAEGMSFNFSDISALNLPQVTVPDIYLPSINSIHNKNLYDFNNNQYMLPCVCYNAEGNRIAGLALIQADAHTETGLQQVFPKATITINASVGITERFVGFDLVLGYEASPI